MDTNFHERNPTSSRPQPQQPAHEETAEGNVVPPLVQVCIETPCGLARPMQQQAPTTPALRSPNDSPVKRFAVADGSVIGQTIEARPELISQAGRFDRFGRLLRSNRSCIALLWCAA